MSDLFYEKITTDNLSHPLLQEKEIEVSVLRIDQIHPVISGNKWFKLKYYSEDAVKNNFKTIATFGGTYSNHIVATAAASNLLGLKSIGIIRGERAAQLSHTLQEALSFGMQLFFISREDYAEKKLPPEIDIQKTYLISEGGYGVLGAKGASEILKQTDVSPYTHICCACGTTTMMAGLVTGSLPHQQVIGFSVMKNNFDLEPSLEKLLQENNNHNYQIVHDYHFGGYAKHKPSLFSFMNDLYSKTGLPTDFVYTGKMLFGLFDKIEKNEFAPGSKVLAIHSGGLQGNASLASGTLIF